MFSPENERNRERTVIKPGNNPYTINSQETPINQTGLSSENNKNSIIEESDGIRAIGGA